VWNMPALREGALGGITFCLFADKRLWYNHHYVSLYNP
jgi:hypothetical protein